MNLKKTMNAREKVLISLRNNIEKGYFSPGQILTVSEFAKQFEVSRTPVREALLSLVDEGFLKVRHRLGFEVTSIDINELLDIYNLRLILETEAIKLAAKRISDKEISDLEKLLITDAERNVAKCNREFHSAIAKVSGSKILCEMIETVLWRGYRGAFLDSYILYPRELGFKSHVEIVSSLKSGDVELSASVMLMHIAQARHRVICGIKENASSDLTSRVGGNNKNEFD